MMKKAKSVIKTAPLLVLALLALPAASQADSELTPLAWQANHWKKQAFVPYLEPAKTPQHTQWNGDVWKPADWIAQRYRESDILHDFYQADIIRDQYINWHGMPVLEVGPGFYMLGGHDKRRVTQTIDYLYQVTSSQSGMYMLYDWRTDKPIGTYTRQGLQIQ